MAHTRPHLLIVSDDPDLASFLSEGLMLAGFWTSVVASALQTLEVCRLRGFDLLLVDAGLAGLGPAELIHRLRARALEAGRARVGCDVPMMVVAGDAAGVPPALVAAADGVLRPPLDIEDLAPRLLAAVTAWRSDHPDRPWADTAAQRSPSPS